jgi:hypothetical protein
MDKKDKILIALAPFALGAVGYIFFGDSLKSDAPLHAETDFTSIEAPVTETRKKRTEIYRDKYEKENAQKFKRNIQSDEYFFTEQISPDSIDTPEPTATSEPETRNPKLETLNPEPKTLNRKPPTSRLKPDVIIRYIERPVAKKDTFTPQPAPIIKRVRRAGFVSQSTSPVITQTDDGQENSQELTIPVVIQEAVDVKSGSNIQLRTLEEVKLNGIVIPKNSLVTGIVSITSERINVKVNSIKAASRTIQMKFNAYDLDGNEGMPVEGGVNKEIKKDVVGSAIQETGRIVNVPILNRLPTTASGNKKINDPVIPVPKGYKLFLKPETK